VPALSPADRGRRATLTRRGLLLAAASAGAAVAAACSSSVRRSASAAHPVTPSGSTTAPLQPAPRTPTSASTRASTPVVSGPATQVAAGPRNRAEVALTFHGQGDPAIARSLLRIFAGSGAAVTVLAVGTWLEQFPFVAREILDGGHELGNHTYRHLDIDSLSAADARQEILRCRNLLMTLTGSPGAHFRQSQAQTATPLVRRLAGEAGYRVCLSYDVDSLDYTDPGPAEVRRRVRSARPGSIVSLHFGHPDTVAAMPGILADLAHRGLRPVTASRLLRP
jgi:peptidoglycan/xylan/chitin deacetylase (PgdA/CDA1 family)